MKKIILLLILFCATIPFLFAQLNTTLLFHWQDSSLVPSWQYDNTYNEIWGVKINETEIAIIGSTAGTHFFDVTNPTSATQVAFVAGGYSGNGVVHRDYHDYNGYLYAVCDEGNTSTLQIIDISNLPNSVNVVYDSNQLFTKSHNIFIDTATAKLYACAVKHTNPNSFSTAMELYSLANPISPTLLYTYNDVNHVHDAYIRNDTAYLNCGNEGLRIMDFSMINSPLTPVQPNLLASVISYPDAGYNHSGWLHDSGTIYAMLDENHGYDIKLLDVSDFNNITVLSTFNSGEDINSMAHNAIIKNNLLFVSYYHDGFRVFDIADPNNPVQICNYDTYLPNSHASYKGAWGVYPYLPSDNILLSDMQTGLYVFDYQNPISSLDVQLPYSNSIFPNPANEMICIKNTSADQLKLYNVLGKEVLHQNIQDNKNIQIGNLTAGIYFYNLYNEEKTIEKGKIILK